MCFVVDDNSLGYYLMFNIPILVYAIMFLLVFFMHGLPVILAKPDAPKNAGDREETLIDKDN